VVASVWDRQYRDGVWKHLDSEEETGHYVAVVEFIRSVGCGRSVLDVGCGHGRLFELLQGAALSRYLGVDISEEAIRQARRFEREGVLFLVADFDCWEPPKPFDVIVFNEALGYARRPLEVLVRYGKWVRADGTLIVSLCEYGNHMWIWRSLEKAFRVTQHRRVENAKGQRWDVKVLIPADRNSA
jgi:2-polyprenyl-3-methyl-5-hydroxy-6-metoxy-1,4-benzoquinol methylase